MKVLQIILTLDPIYGGPVKVCLDMSRELVRQGALVTIYTTKFDSSSGLNLDQKSEEVYENGIRIRYFPVQFRPMAVSLQMAAALWREIMEYDIVHIHGLYRFPQAFAAWCARRKGVPYLISTHGTLDPYLFHHQRNRLIKRLYERPFALPNLHGASAIHFTTEEEQEKVKFLKLQAPGVIVPNGVDWQDFRHLPPIGKLRERLGFKDEQIVLFLGRIHFKKGLDLLVKGFEKAANHFPKAHLIIAGPDNEGYGKKILQWISAANITDRVSFTGMLDRQEVLEAYVDADVFALPSYSENFGIVIAEAMACECPVVISNNVDIWRDIEKAGAGLVVPCDEEALGNALMQLLGDSNKRQNMGEAGRNFVRNNYNWEKIGPQMLSIYKELIQSSGR